MKLVKMLEDHQGARKGDIVGIESDAEAAALIEQKKAEVFPPVAEQPTEG